MQKKKLYIKNTKVYSGWKSNRRSIGRYVKGIVGLSLTAVLCCSTMVYAVSDNNLENEAGAGLSDNNVESLGDMKEQEQVSGNMVLETGVEENTGIVSEEDTVKLPEDIVVVLDPGHGGEDEGCSRNGVLEKDINLEIARAVETKLKEKGYQVVLTREGDVTRSKEERVDKANAAQGDLYISIHQNASETPEPDGMEVWYCSGRFGRENERLAELMQKYIVKKTEVRERELVQTDSLYVIRESGMPSCLIETGFLSNAVERKKLTDPEYQEKMAAGIADAVDLYFYPKTMYLTFDDGPSAENTNAILDILKERNIKATFFLVGENVLKHPEVARRIAAEGHTIGIHCNCHVYEDIYADADSYIADFEEAYRIIYEVTGVEVKLFRFPGGSINAYNKKVYKEIIKRMEEKGFIYFDWNASLEDAVSHAEPETLLENAVSSTLGRRKIVMLAHDTVHATAVCLEDIIDAFPEYRMLPLTEDVEPVWF